MAVARINSFNQFTFKKDTFPESEQVSNLMGRKVNENFRIVLICKLVKGDPSKFESRARLIIVILWSGSGAL